MFAIDNRTHLKVSSYEGLINAMERGALFVKLERDECHIGLLALMSAQSKAAELGYWINCREDGNRIRVTVIKACFSLN